MRGRWPMTVRSEFLALLISDGVARRDQKKFSTRLRQAQFRTTKMLEQFDFDRLPHLNRALVHDLVDSQLDSCACRSG